MGCSVLLINGPKPLPEPPSCELTPWPVIGDGVMAGASLFTAAGFGIASLVSENPDHQRAYATTGQVLLVVTLIEAVSAGVGFYRLARCSSAIDDYNALHPQPRQAPYPQQYPAPYPQPYPPQQQPQQPYPAPYPQQPPSGPPGAPR